MKFIGAVGILLCVCIAMANAADICEDTDRFGQCYLALVIIIMA